MRSIKGELSLQVEGSTPEEEELWRIRRERMKIAFEAAPTTGQQEPAELYALFCELAEVLVKVANVDEFISKIEELAGHADPSAVFNTQGPWNDSLLHVAAFSGKDDILRLLVDNVGDNFVAAKNDWGHTPLHVVVSRKGSTGAAEMLIGRARVALRMKSISGDTPLHLAVLRGTVEMVRYLLSEDLEPVYLENATGDSPLHLAFATNVAEMHEIFISLPLETSRIQGYPPLLAAVASKNKDLIGKIRQKNRKLLGKTGPKFLNVFHLAANCNWPQVSELLGRETKYLVGERDIEERLPIHIASKMGCVELIEKLHESSQRLNGQGQTILHVATKYGRASVVRYILRHPKLRVMINDLDQAGNTALHLAAMHSQPAALIPLLLHKGIWLEHFNNKGMTAPEIARRLVDSGYTVRKQLTHLAFACRSNERLEPVSTSYFILSPEARNGKSESVRSPKNKPEWDLVKEFINSRMVVAALVATVTFAAGFAVPGGFSGSDTASKDDRGMATMLDNRLFQVFVICNTVAMFCSMIAVANLIWARVSDVQVAITAYENTTLPLNIALPAMGIAFLSGVTLTVGKLPWLANTTFYLGLLFLLIMSSAKFLECPPLFMIRVRLIRGFTFWLIRAYIRLWRFDTHVDEDAEPDRTVREIFTSQPADGANKSKTDDLATTKCEDAPHPPSH